MLHEVPVSEAIIDVLIREGVVHIYGVPGGPLTPLFEAMHARGDIRLVLAKHEGGAAFMAAAHARVTGQLAVCCGTSGPGATNALTGIASAATDGLPVLMLSGQVASHAFGRGAIQDSSTFGVDLVSVFRPVTKLSCALPSAERSVDVMRGAIRLALSGRPGPVHISMPADMLHQRVAYEPLEPLRYRASRAALDMAGVSQAATLLKSARRPCILAGHGVLRAAATDCLLSFAEAWNIPVATSPKGKSAFPEHHRLSLGVVGFGGHDAAEKYLEDNETDVIMVIGSSLNEFVTNGWRLRLRPRTALIHLDSDPSAIGRAYPVELAVIGDAALGLGELARLAGEDIAEDAKLEKQRVPRSEHARARMLDAKSLEDERAPMHPARVIHALQEALPANARLFVDTGNSIVWATHYFIAREPASFFLDLGFGAMGSAVAGVVGAAIADPSRPAIALVGDGAFAMHGFEVHTAVEENLPVIWVVLNNSGHGMVAQGDRINHGKDLRVSAFGQPIDAARLARSLGAVGVSVSAPDEMMRALKSALASNQPTVIDVTIDASVLAPTLAKRVKTLVSFKAPDVGAPSRD